MGLNDTPSANRVHIAFFGKRNAGKSSVVNAFTNQEMSLVSDVLGTTTDPVTKAMELLPIGPVLIIDTPGIDDEGELGEKRVKKTIEILNKTDIAVLVVDACVGLDNCDFELIEKFNKKNIKYVIVYNKCDLEKTKIKNDNEILISAKTKENINKLKEKIVNLIKDEENNKRILGDLIAQDDVVLLVTPIDSAAPKGRIILPQQQTIRDILDSDATAIVVKETRVQNTLENLIKKPRLVVCDSQVFSYVSKIVPKDIPLTSFSILFARLKGDLDEVVEGVRKIEELSDNDTVLVCEGCTHHRQCDDIGTVKIPKWIREYTGKNINFHHTSGLSFVDDFSKYKMIVHCGGCMLNDREMKNRLSLAKENNIPITNYGILIAYIKGILDRSIEIFS